VRKREGEIIAIDICKNLPNTANTVVIARKSNFPISKAIFSIP